MNEKIRENILTRLDGATYEIEISRPEKKNALTTAMYSALAAAIEEAEAAPEVRVILIHGQNEAFTAGNDLRDFLDAPVRSEDAPVFRFLRRLSTLKKPMIAAIEGVAVGIGTTLLLHCDLAYAGAGARFMLPFVNLGLCPEAASSLLLPRLAGHARASELLLLGEPFSAARAQEIGLVNAVLPDGEALAHARARAARLAAQPPAAVQLSKALLKRSVQPAISETLEEEIRHFGERLQSPEAKEAFTAFFEKRPPDFSRFS